MKIRNTFIIFLVSGFWHGANWTFIVWGFLNALYIMPSIIFNTNRNNLGIVAKGRVFPNSKEFSSILITFLLTVFAWIFFRSNHVLDAFVFIKNIFTFDIFKIPEVFPVKILLLVLFFIIIEWIGRENKYALEKLLLSKNIVIRLSFYYLLILLIISFSGKEQNFIYFQF